MPCVICLFVLFDCLVLIVIILINLYFYFQFRSDPKLFTDDVDIKYCKALNCCKLPKVSA